MTQESPRIAGAFSISDNFGLWGSGIFVESSIISYSK